MLDLRRFLRRLTPLLLLPLAAQAANVTPAPCITPAACAAEPDNTPAPRNARDADARALDAALVNRITWGATPAELARLHELGTARYLQAQLHPDPRARLPAAVQQRIDALSISRQSADDAQAEQRAMRKDAKEADPESRQQAQRDARIISRQRADDTASRAFYRALYSPNQLQEQMTWFWMNHFSVYAAKNDIGTYIDQYEERAIRPRALGKFRDLLAATLRSPAMLVYLDNTQNAVGRINENYARELMELHTLGVKGGYTQNDVQELARILTGLGIRNPDGPPKLRPELRGQLVQDGLFLFNPARHDYGDKVFLGHTIRGAGLAEVDQAVDLLARHPATARFVSTKLAAYFMGDAPPASVIDKMSKTFLARDGDIAAILQTLFTSPEFAQSLKTGVFKDPVHYVYSALRLAYADLPPIVSTRPGMAMLRQLGQPLNQRLTPDGYPQAQSDWAGSGQMTARFEVARAIAAGPQAFYREGDDKGPVELPRMPDLLRENADDGLFARLSPATRQAIAQARTPKDANTYLLASPEFMRR
ncbi:DUF1800 domain-containing protein [Achromobacter sp. UMC71]|uniref:DUF1800 domain-containing protein n=1 Tax=Achromobacter sp. UMC71 TaxID=1862320 RepID=UPI0015FF32EF|nr:DUF1800 domain-containing protein [Achromobacter sp. UMC71]MBB1624586.1 hypothetical protein [Achromobacter sp. UMC71]